MPPRSHKTRSWSEQRDVSHWVHWSLSHIGLNHFFMLKENRQTCSKAIRRPHMVIRGKKRSWRGEESRGEQKNIITVGNHQAPTCMGTTAESNGMVFDILHMGGGGGWTSLEIPVAFITISSFFFTSISETPGQRICYFSDTSILWFAFKQIIVWFVWFELNVGKRTPPSRGVFVQEAKIPSNCKSASLWPLTYNPEGSKERSSSLEIIKEL